MVKELWEKAGLVYPWDRLICFSWDGQELMSYATLFFLVCFGFEFSSYLLISFTHIQKYHSPFPNLLLCLKICNDAAKFLVPIVTSFLSPLVFKFQLSGLNIWTLSLDQFPKGGGGNTQKLVDRATALLVHKILSSCKMYYVIFNVLSR